MKLVLYIFPYVKRLWYTNKKQKNDTDYVLRVNYTNKYFKK